MTPARHHASGVVAGLICLSGGVVWGEWSRPKGWPFLVLWFAAVAIAGSWLPGVANQVTLVRAHLAAPGLVYALSPQGLVPLAAVAALAGLTDVADGRLARSRERPTRLGGALDPVVDGICFGAIAVGLAGGAAYPAWLADVVVLRYLLPALVGGLLLVAGRRPELRHTPVGQVSTALVAILLGGIALLRGVGLDARIVVTVAEVLLPLAGLATFANLAWSNRGAIFGPPTGV